MTAEGVELAMQQVEEGNTGEKVLVVYLPDVHEVLQESLQEESGRRVINRLLC